MAELDPPKPGEPGEGAAPEPERIEPAPTEPEQTQPPERAGPSLDEHEAEESASPEATRTPDEPTSAAGPAAKTCLHCKAVRNTSGSFCPACGALYDASSVPKGYGIEGCLAVVAGILVGAVGCFGLVALSAVIGGSSDVAFGIVLVVADIAAIALGIFLVSRRGQIRFALFLIAMTLTFAGLLTACSLLMFSFSKTKF